MTHPPVRPTTRVSVYLDTWQEIKELSKQDDIPFEIIMAAAICALKKQCPPRQLSALVKDWAEKGAMLTNQGL